MIFNKTLSALMQYRNSRTYGKAMDLNSVNTSQTNSQMRYNPISGDPNDPSLSTSQYEIRDCVFASIIYTNKFFKNASTTISLFNNGETVLVFIHLRKRYQQRRI